MQTDGALPMPDGGLTAADRRNLWRYHAWLITWLVLWIGARLVLDAWGAALHGAAGWALVAGGNLPGLGAMRAYVRFLRDTDELQRKIQVEALAFAFGVGAVFMMAWRLIEMLGGPTLDVNDPLLVMFAAWALGQWLGARTYR